MASPEREKCVARSSRTGKRCGRWPIHGGTVCATHGGSTRQVKEKAAQRLQEQKALALAKRTVGSIDLSQYADPFEALEFAISYSFAFAERLAKIVESIPDGELRYRGKISEQLRGEVVAAQTAMRDLRQAAVDSARLGLAERRQRLDEREVLTIERALDAALQAAGLDLRQQEAARKVIRAELERAGTGDAA